MEGFSGLSFPPCPSNRQTHSTKAEQRGRGWGNVEVQQTGDLTHFSCASWPHRCLGMETFLRGYAGKQDSSERFHDWFCQSAHLHHLYLVPGGSKLMVTLWVTCSSEVSVSHATAGELCPRRCRRCSLQKTGCASPGRPAKSGLVKTLIMPFNKLD